MNHLKGFLKLIRNSNKKCKILYTMLCKYYGKNLKLLYKKENNNIRYVPWKTFSK